tara:strand:+ start:128 stop:364 length:237 start_codon:yes stop_codon:yes gene_type:complete
MAKVKVTIGYIYYVMDEGPAFALFKAINGSTVERLDSKYDADSKTNIYKTLPVEAGFLSLSAVSNEDYAIWKLTGASE